MIHSERLEAFYRELIAEIKRLKIENEQLKQQNRDLLISLSTTAEHGDIVEAQLQQINLQLKAEIAQRQQAQVMLQELFTMISQERNDLEIIVQTIVEHGDVVDTQWEQKLKEAMQLAELDGLTQVANRRKFDTYLAYQWQEMARQQTVISVIICDIDYFKQYNDTYGHLAGDFCLQQVAKTLQSSLKRGGDLFARYGGEEFAAILPQTEENGAIQVAQRMQAAIASRRIAHRQSTVAAYVTLSIGVACTVPCHLRSPNSLLDKADQRLYLAKQQGRNKIIHRYNCHP